MLPQREKTRSDKNLIREKDKHDEKEELVRFYSREDIRKNKEFICEFFFRYYHFHNQSSPGFLCTIYN